MYHSFSVYRPFLSILFNRAIVIENFSRSFDYLRTVFVISPDVLSLFAHFLAFGVERSS